MKQTSKGRRGQALSERDPALLCGNFGHNNRAGKPCRNFILQGREACKKHGGRALRGADHPGYKHGLYSKFMPKKLREQYENLQADPKLMELESQAALLATRQVDLLRDLEALGESEDAIDLMDAYKALRGTMAKGGEWVGPLERLGKALKSHQRKDQLWGQLVANIDGHRKIIDSKTRASTSFTAETAIIFVNAVAAIVKREVKDRDTLVSIGNAVRALTERSGTPGGGQGRHPPPSLMSPPVFEADIVLDQ